MEQYEVGRVLGQGAQGRALLVTRRSDGAQLAMKQMGYADMSAAEQKASIHEVGLLSRLQHPNIIGYHDAFLEDGQLCIVMELASGGSLEDELATARTSGVQLSEQRLLDLLAQLADAVHYMHACRVIHRDIKPANILLSQQGANGAIHAYLADTGFAKAAQAQRGGLSLSSRRGPCYTPGY